MATTSTNFAAAVTVAAPENARATVTVALENSAMSARACDGLRLWASQKPEACAWGRLPPVAELVLQLKEHRWYFADRGMLTLSISSTGQPGEVSLDLAKVDEAPATAEALVGLPGGVGGEMLHTLLRRRDELRAALEEQKSGNAARETKRSATEASLRDAVEDVQRAEVDEYATCLPLLRAKQARLDTVEKDAVARLPGHCWLPDDDDEDTLT